MKKKNLILSAMLFFSILPIALFTGCDKDTTCYLEIETVSETLTNPISGEVLGNIPIAGAQVEVYQDGGIKHAIGISNIKGIFTTRFDSPAIVKIKAQYDDGTSLLKGENTVRLKEGETVSAKVILAR